MEGWRLNGRVACHLPFPSLDTSNGFMAMDQQRRRPRREIVRTPLERSMCCRGAVVDAAKRSWSAQMTTGWPPSAVARGRNAMDASARAHADIDGRYAWMRLVASVLLSTVGSVGMWSVVVVLPEVQAEFGVDRASASL